MPSKALFRGTLGVPVRWNSLCLWPGSLYSTYKIKDASASPWVKTISILIGIYAPYTWEFVRMDSRAAIGVTRYAMAPL